VRREDRRVAFRARSRDSLGRVDLDGRATTRVPVELDFLPLMCDVQVVGPEVHALHVDLLLGRQERQDMPQRQPAVRDQRVLGQPGRRGNSQAALGAERLVLRREVDLRGTLGRPAQLDLASLGHQSTVDAEADLRPREEVRPAQQNGKEHHAGDRHQDWPEHVGHASECRLQPHRDPRRALQPGLMDLLMRASPGRDLERQAPGWSKPVAAAWTGGQRQHLLAAVGDVELGALRLAAHLLTAGDHLHGRGGVAAI
jgi:hypothetical protein